MSQSLTQDEAIGCVVIHDQDGESAKRLQFHRLSIGQRETANSQRHFEMKGAAATRFALHPNRPSHESYQASRDGESQAGAAILAGGRAVRLAERFKDHLLFFRRNANPGIGHAEVKIGPAGAFGARLHMQGDLAAGGKFQSIAQQIDENLPQAGRVAGQGVGHRGRNMAIEFETLLMGADGQLVEEVLQAVAQAEIRGLNGQLAGFDFREIENIVDEGEQGVGRTLDQAQAFALFGAEVGLKGQFGHTDDPVHGRADFVAHVGQEFALGPIGGFRGFFGDVQFYGVPIQRELLIGHLLERFLAAGEGLGQLNFGVPALRDHGAQNQAGGREDQHEQTYAGEHSALRRVGIHTNHHPEVQNQESHRGLPYSLAHRHPENRNKTKVEQLEGGPSGSEHDEQGEQDDYALA